MALTLFILMQEKNTDIWEKSWIGLPTTAKEEGVIAPR